ncbi:MAG: nickel-responsive transcriptional regulator NikR [Deltaproteobacteria bacterium]|nr:nickel-responsive transcriptional regulator NikR [Deltaproteobacteria bacterium]
MSEIARFGVSLERSLLEQFDRVIRGRHYTSRSEALRDLIRKELTAEQLSDDGEVAGAITFVYDHHKKELVNRILDTQHNFQNIVISTQHIHLDHDSCLEIIAVRGNAGAVKAVADLLQSLKGVRHCTLSLLSI